MYTPFESAAEFKVMNFLRIVIHLCWRQVNGALWLVSKMFTLKQSKIDIVAGSDDWMVGTSTVEASNIAYVGVSIYSLRIHERRSRTVIFQLFFSRAFLDKSVIFMIIL